MLPLISLISGTQLLRFDVLPPPSDAAKTHKYEGVKKQKKGATENDISYILATLEKEDVGIKVERVGEEGRTQFATKEEL